MKRRKKVQTFFLVLLGLSDSREEDVVAARMDAAHRLKAAGFGVVRIGEILKRDHAVIRYYLNKIPRENNRTRQSLRRRRRLLPDDIRAAIDEIAELEGVPPHVLLSQWISERARYEIEARARDARSVA